MNAFAKIQFFFIITLVSVVFFSCDPNEKLPFETILEYRGCQYFSDSTNARIAALNLQVHLQDGNGNIGLEDIEAEQGIYVGKYAYNLYVYVFDKQTDGTYKPMQTLSTEPDDIFFAYRIPILSTDFKSSVKGMLDIRVQGEATFDIMQSISKQGVVRFEIFMYDRDTIQSNIITTPDIQIR